MAKINPVNTHPITMAEAVTWLDDEAEALHNGINRRASNIHRTHNENDRLIERDLMREDVREIATIDFILQRLKWQPMDKAPKDATWVLVKTKGGNIYRAHWASDLSGSAQPAFQGWFRQQSEDERHGFTGVQAELVGWMAVPE